MSDLIGRTALITGANSGIGRAVTLALIKEGVKVAACSRSLPGLQTLKEEVETRG